MNVGSEPRHRLRLFSRVSYVRKEREEIYFFIIYRVCFCWRTWLFPELTSVHTSEMSTKEYPLDRLEVFNIRMELSN
jgi:hypothetical protein